MPDEPGVEGAAILRQKDGADERPGAAAQAPEALRARRELPPAVAWLLAHPHLPALVAAVTLVWLCAAVLWNPEAMQRYGYLGVFVTTLVATGGMVLPVPYLLAVAAAGAVLNPFLVGLVAGFASALGELTGYMVGFAGLPVLRRGSWHRSAERWVKRRGFWAVFLLAAVPNPLFDAAGIAAGSLGMPIGRFWLAAFCGKTLRLTLIAWLASQAPALLALWLR